MSTRRGILASTPVVLAVAMVAISACDNSLSSRGTTATPTFSPGAGAVNAGQKVTISVTTPNAAIFYTVDGTQPKASVTGTTKKYTAPISIDVATTIKAVALASGFNPSMVASAAYTWDEEEGAYLPFELDVLTFEGDRIKEVTAFITRMVEGTEQDYYTNWPTQPLDRARFVFEQFGLPGRLD